MNYQPPFDITSDILSLSQSISGELGRLTGAKNDAVAIVLRRENSIKTIQASLAIEGNTLDFDQISTLLEGKRVIGPKNDITEVKNAIAVYDKISQYDPLQTTHLLEAHQRLMNGLAKDNGQLRRGNMGICKGGEIMHMAPPANHVPQLMKDLFDFLNHDRATPWLLKACVFHYELEFIHPFSDGNGRMGRLWQQLLLMKENPIFQFIPVETVIKEHQQEYYSVLSQCDKEGKSNKFISFCLQRILEALNLFSEKAVRIKRHPETRLAYASVHLEGKWFSRKHYIEIHEEISTATASRDLLLGISNGTLTKKGQGNQIKYQFNPKKTET